MDVLAAMDVLGGGGDWRDRFVDAGADAAGMDQRAAFGGRYLTGRFQ